MLHGSPWPLGEVPSEETFDPIVEFDSFPFLGQELAPGLGTAGLVGRATHGSIR
jgi:hypothetical protein